MFNKGDIITTWDAGLKIIGTFSHVEYSRTSFNEVGQPYGYPCFFCQVQIDEDINKETILNQTIDYQISVEDLEKKYHLATEEEKKLYHSILKKNKESKKDTSNKSVEINVGTKIKSSSPYDLYFNTSEQNVWFTSDMHIGHSNIINFCQRPFKNVEEMNEALINNWNERVDENDVVFILGDFCFGGSQLWNETLDRLKGKKYLIIGNHDLKNLKQGYLQKFEKVSYMMNIHVDGQLIYLSHFPLLCFAGSYRDKKPVWALFGHVHSNPKLKNGIDSRRLAVLFPSQYDVGVDNNDYKPISFSEVKEIITKQKKSLKWQIKGKIMDFIMKIIYKHF